MKTEVQHAVTFLVDTIKEKLPRVSPEEMERLRARLSDLLLERYENHWYVDKPLKGSAFRCINISIEDNSIDLVLRKAANESGISKEDLINVFSKGLALWVDPDDVSGRMGKGAIFPIYKKIVDNRSAASENTNPPLHHRPQQRPRSISPQAVIASSAEVPSSQPLSRTSKTPPGFRTLDAGQMFQLPHIARSEYPSNSNIPSLWQNHSPSSSHQVKPARNLVTYESANKPFNATDAVYSFNQYSSYYNPHLHWRKESQFNGGIAQSKSLWQDDETYQRTHWFRESKSNNMSVAGNNLTMNKVQSYSYGISRQAQEVY